MFQKITSLFKNQQGGIHSSLLKKNYQKLTSFCLMFLLLFQVIGGVFLFDLSSNTAQAAYLALTPNSDLSIAGPYDVATSGTGQWSCGTACATPGYREFVTMGQKYRIRQNGTISRIRLYTASTSGLTGFYLKVWRKNGSNYDLVGTSNNITSNLIAGSTTTIDLTSPISGVQEGDYYGYRIEASSNVSHFVARTTAPGGTSYLVDNVTPSNIGYDWEGKTHYTGQVLPIELYMQSPQVAFIGDSIIAGHPSHYSFLETTATTNIASTIENHFGILTGYTYQNMGIGSQFTPQIAARFTNDVVNLHPRVAIIEGGVNDVSGGTITKTDFLGNWTTMLNACQSNNIIPVVIPIMPWTGGTTVQMNTRDDWNASLVTLAHNYSKAIIVDMSSSVGQFRAGGPAGNLWDIQTAYNADGVHYNSTGYGVVAQTLANALVESTDHLTITGNTSQIAGNTQTVTLRAYNNFGDIHTAYTGDKIITFSGASTIGAHHPTFIDKSGNEVNFGSSGTIAFTNGVATVDVSLYKDEIAEIDATDGTNSTSGDAGYDLNIDVSPGTIDSFDVTSPSGITSETPFSLLLTAEDAYGNTTTGVANPTTLSVNYGTINPSSIPNTEFQDNGISTNNITISEIYADRNIILTIRNGSITQTINLSVTGVSHGVGYIPPTKPIIAPTDLISGTVPSNITQIAISRTPDFTNISWQPFDKDKFKNIDQTTETLYVKFRTDQGAVSDVIVYTPQANQITQILNEGDIVKTPNNPDVYVIKYKNNKQYKRLILSPFVFKSYQHLKWENIKIVSQQQLDKYTTSNLVKETIDTIIYLLFPNGDTGERKEQDTSTNYDSDSVYEINKTDRDSYILAK